MITQCPPAPAPPTELRLEGEHHLSALHTLADSSRLTTLLLNDCILSDLSPLAELPLCWLLYISDTHNWFNGAHYHLISFG